MFHVYSVLGNSRESVYFGPSFKLARLLAEIAVMDGADRSCVKEFGVGAVYRVTPELLRQHPTRASRVQYQ